MKKKMKHLIAVTMCLVLSISVLSGCGGSSESTGSKEKADSLNIMVWEGTWSEEMFQDFTKETGIKVNISYIDNTDTLLAKMIEGSADYDLIDLEGAYVKSFLDGELLAPIDKSKVKNVKNIQENFLKEGPIGDTEEKYTIPNMGCSYTTIVYNKETCPIKITSFKDLANPKLKGKIAMVNSTISLYGEALAACGFKPDSTNEEEMKKANELLTQIKANVKAFVGESAVSQLENGECPVAFCWDYTTLCVDSKDNWDKFEAVALKEGCERFQQYWAIPAASEKQSEATELIDFLLRPEENAKSNAEYGGVPNLKQDLLAPHLDKDFYDSPALKKEEELFPISWSIAVFLLPPATRHTTPPPGVRLFFVLAWILALLGLFASPLSPYADGSGTPGGTFGHPLDFFLLAASSWLLFRHGLRSMRVIFIALCAAGPLAGLAWLPPDLPPADAAFALSRAILALAACICLWLPSSRAWLVE